jgi:hypothetical protein
VGHKMTKSEETALTGSPSHRRTHRSWGHRLAARLWSEWRVEILIVLLVALAIFLLVERMQIRQTLLGWLRQGLGALRSLGGSALRAAVDFIRNTTLSDLTGYVLLLVALAFMAWRLRWRLMAMPRFRASTCPRCGGGLHRVHRRWHDRVVSLFVPVRRYRCGDRTCGWSGLRVAAGRHGS